MSDSIIHSYVYQNDSCTQTDNFFYEKFKTDIDNIISTPSTVSSIKKSISCSEKQITIWKFGFFKLKKIQYIEIS